MRGLLFSLAMIAMAGCLAEPSPEAPVAPGEPSTPGIPQRTYSCPEGGTMSGTEPCRLVFASPTGAQMAQDIVASPTVPGLFAMAVYANDVAESTHVLGRQAVPAWTSWLAVTKDGGRSWERRDLPALLPPTAVEDLLLRQLAFSPEGALHAVVALVQDDGFQSAETPATVIHLQSEDGGASWGQPTVLGNTQDARSVAFAVASETAWMATWPGPADRFSYAATRDGGATLEQGEAGDGPCTYVLSAVPVTDGIVADCASDQDVAIYHWSMADGALEERGPMPGKLGNFVDAMAMGSDGRQTIAYAVNEAGDAQTYRLSRDGGKTWPRSEQSLDGVELDGWDFPGGRFSQSPVFDDEGRLHLLDTPDRQANSNPLLGPLDTAIVHVVRDVDGAGANGTILHVIQGNVPVGPDPLDLQAPGIRYLSPKRTFAFQGTHGLVIIPGNGAFGVTMVDWSMPPNRSA